MLPRTVLYDPSLTLSLPPDISAASGINAMAHAVEALYAEDANPVISLMAEESIRALGEALPVVVRDPANRDARSRALYGAWLAGTCRARSAWRCITSCAHAWRHLQPATRADPCRDAAAYRALQPRCRADALRRVARALGGSDAAEALLFALNARLGIAPALADLGMPEAGLDEAADLACRNPYVNPRPIEREAIRALLQRAWEARAAMNGRMRQRRQP